MEQNDELSCSWWFTRTKKLPDTMERVTFSSLSFSPISPFYKDLAILWVTSQDLFFLTDTNVAATSGGGQCVRASSSRPRPNGLLHQHTHGSRQNLDRPLIGFNNVCEWMKRKKNIIDLLAVIISPLSLFNGTITGGGRRTHSDNGRKKNSYIARWLQNVPLMYLNIDIHFIQSRRRNNKKR